MKSLAIFILLSATSTAADSPLRCYGHAPDWSLEIAGTTALFSYPLSPNSAQSFDIPQRSQPEGAARHWPQAMTLIADFDTAIVVLDRANCQTGDDSTTTDSPSNIRAHILTQRNQTPILLTGCCEPQK
jgi:hypothetical protein